MEQKECPESFVLSNELRESHAKRKPGPEETSMGLTFIYKCPSQSQSASWGNI
jgi:hypothetical protein